MLTSDTVIAELRRRGHTVLSPVTGSIIVNDVAIDGHTWDRWAGRGASYIVSEVNRELKRRAWEAKTQELAAFTNGKTE